MSASKKTFDPGAMKFGNFMNYYQFHSPEERVHLLSSDIWQTIKLDFTDEKDIVCLDVGCNCGDLTESLYEMLTKNVQTSSNQVKILGIDIDQTLIDRANKKNNYSDNIVYLCSDIMEENTMQKIKSIQNFNSFDEFKKTVNHTTKSDKILNKVENLDTIVSQRNNSIFNETKVNTNEIIPDISEFFFSSTKNDSSTAKRSHENSVDLKVVENSNLCTESDVNKEKIFDFVFCFSLTMWIHLNYHDEGLFEFLKKISKITKYLFMENQLWKCYRQAQRRMTKNKMKNDLFDDLERREKGENIKSNDIKREGNSDPLREDDGENNDYEREGNTSSKRKNNEKSDVNGVENELNNDLKIQGNSNPKREDNRENSDLHREDNRKNNDLHREENEVINDLKRERKSDPVIDGGGNHDLCKKENKDSDHLRKQYEEKCYLEKNKNIGNSTFRKNENCDFKRANNEKIKHKIIKEENGFKYYKELKLRSNVEEEIDKYLVQHCNAVKIFQSKPNEWGRVINIYKIK